jgi:flagellar assembly protein FliH
MSSRLSTPEEGKAPEPLAWRRIGEPTAAAEAARETREEDLRREYELRVSQAHTAGYQEGQAAAQQTADAELRGIAERSARAIEEIASLRHRLRRQAEADLVQLAMAIARRILHRELAVDPEAMRGLILSALERIQAQEISRARVHPGHASILRACLERISAERVEILADPALAPGGIVFETERGNLDASVGTQLEEIGCGLADRLRRESI